ncbi:MAG: hypothetical protein AB8G22_13765 [Saprospiraceae bacterium]
MEKYLMTFFGIFVAVILLQQMRSYSSDAADYYQVEGVITEVTEYKYIRKRQRHHYKFRIQHDNPIYRQKLYTNTRLYDMKSGVDYGEILQRGKRVRFHIMPRGIWKDYEVLAIYSLQIEQQVIVPFGNQWKLILGTLAVFILVIGGTFLVLIKK